MNRITNDLFFAAGLAVSEFLTPINRGVGGPNRRVEYLVADRDVAWHCGTQGKYRHLRCRNHNSIVEVFPGKKHKRLER